MICLIPIMNTTKIMILTRKNFKSILKHLTTLNMFFGFSVKISDFYHLRQNYKFNYINLLLLIVVFMMIKNICKKLVNFYIDL